MKNKLFILFLFILAIIPTLALFHSGLPITHDGQDQVARIANFYQNLVDGNLIPRWAANLNWGYGHPVLEFLYPLPSYIASFFHVFGFNFVDAAKIVFGLGIIFSFLFMYLFLSQFNSKYASIFGAFLYTYAPYRFIDVYVRGDIGENLALAFVPLVLFFIYKTYKKQTFENTVLGGVSLALLILAHNAISLMALPFILFYSGYLIFVSKNRKSLAINLVSLISLGFAFSAFFWVPGLLEGKYTLRNIVTKGAYLGRFVSFGQLIYGNWNYGQTGQFTVQLGILQWISLILSPFVAFKLYKKKNKNYIFVAGLILLCLSGIFLMLPVSNFIWAKFMLLQNFQFPWRFLTVTIIATSILSVYAFSLVIQKYQKYVLIVAVLLVFFLQRNYFVPKGYQYKPGTFYSGVYDSTTDTGESSPIWSIRGMGHTPTAPIQVIAGTGTVRELDHKSTLRLYSFDSSTSARILLNILYFPGWTVYVDGTKTPTLFQDPAYRGLMTFRVVGGHHVIKAVFLPTKLREISDYISFLSILGILGFYVLRFFRKKVY